MHELMTDKDREIVENVLVEILVLAMKSSDHIRPWITELAIGLTSCLDEEQVNRAKEYAKFRATASK